MSLFNHVNPERCPQDTADEYPAGCYDCYHVEYYNVGSYAAAEELADEADETPNRLGSVRPAWKSEHTLRPTMRHGASLYMMVHRDLIWCITRHHDALRRSMMHRGAL